MVKRVLQVIGGMNRAGAETFIMNVYRSIDRTKIQFDFLVYSDEIQDYEEEINSLGGRVLRVKKHSGVHAFRYVASIRKILIEYGPYCAVHAHTLHNSAFAMIAAKKYKNIIRIVHSHSTCNRTRSGFHMRIYNDVTKLMIKKYVQVQFACGDEAGRYLFGKNFNKTGHVIQNGIHLQEFIKNREVEVADLRKNFNLNNEIVIGSVARLQDVKNHNFMLDIANELKKESVKFKMFFVGDGENRAIITNKILSLNLEEEVLLLGVRADIPELLAFFDVFLMPSLFEGNPVALIEAQATGLPCVITDSISENIDAKMGLIHRCSLDANLFEWVKILVSHNRKTKCKFGNAMPMMNASGYNIDIVSKNLLKYYLGNIDGAK